MKCDCENCMNYEYDEFYDDYSCIIEIDEDEYVRLMSDEKYSCPYFRRGDEYTIVRKQN